MRRLLVSVGTVAFILVAMVLGTSRRAVAQDETPAAGEAVPPEECLVEPFDLLPIMEELIATPAAEEATEVAGMDQPEATRPTGEPADEETVEAVTATIREFIACVNAGYDARIIFLFSDRYLREFLVTEVDLPSAEELPAIAEEALTEEANPLPPEEQTTLVSIEDVEVLDDGRVVATVIGDDLSLPSGPSPVYIFFVEEDGRYLIDGIIDPVDDDEATPAA